MCGWFGAAGALAGMSARLAADRRTDGLAQTPIVCLFKSRGACKLNRVVATIAAWKAIEQCGVISALSELRTQPGLCEFFGDSANSEPQSPRPARRNVRVASD
jgi:hypothetical protein